MAMFVMDDETHRLSTDDNKFQTSNSDVMPVEAVQDTTPPLGEEAYSLNSVSQDDSLALSPPATQDDSLSPPPTQEDPLSPPPSPATPPKQSWEWEVDGAKVLFTPQHFYQLHEDRFNSQVADSFIGQGSFGSVFKYFCSITGKTIAIKQITINNRSPKLISKTNKAFRREVDNHKRLDHVNVLKFIDSIQFNDVLAIVVEYAEQGSLDAMIMRDVFCRDKILAHTRQILTGLSYLHSSHIVHKDLRCDNILMSGEGVIKLADFGISKPLGELMSSFSKSLVGNLYWSAPEQKVRLLQAAGTERSVRSQTAKDIWSLGVAILEMYYYGKRQVPYMKRYKEYQYILKLNEGYYPKIPQSAPTQLQELLRMCFVYKGNERPTAEELLKEIQKMVELKPELLTTLGLVELTDAELDKESTLASHDSGNGSGPVDLETDDYLDKASEDHTTSHLKPGVAKGGLSHPSHNLGLIRETSEIGNQTNWREGSREELIQIVLQQNEQISDLRHKLEVENASSIAMANRIIDFNRIIALQSELIAELRKNKN